MFFVGRDFEPIDCLKKIDFLIKCFFEGLFSLFFSEGLVAFDFFELSDSPHLSWIKNYLKFLVQNFEIFLSFGISSSLNLFFVALFFCLAEFALLFEFNLVLLKFLIFEFGGEFSCEPASGQTLYEQGGFVSPVFPHFTVKIHVGLDQLISALIDKEAFFLHLGSDLSLGFGGLGNLIIGLSLSCKAEFMVGFFLIGLCKSIPVLSVVLDVGVATDERFAFINSDNFDYFSPLVDDVALFVSLYDC